jgi:hypothetical protein
VLRLSPADRRPDLVAAGCRKRADSSGYSTSRRMR